MALSGELKSNSLFTTQLRTNANKAVELMQQGVGGITDEDITKMDVGVRKGLVSKVQSDLGHSSKNTKNTLLRMIVSELKPDSEPNKEDIDSAIRLMQSGASSNALNMEGKRLLLQNVSERFRSDDSLGNICVSLVNLMDDIQVARDIEDEKFQRLIAPIVEERRRRVMVRYQEIVAPREPEIPESQALGNVQDCINGGCIATCP